MGSESTMRSFVTAALRKLDAHPVENRVFVGTPDVEFIGGWMELKQEKEWPARENTSLRLKRYTKEQKAWARIRMYRGGVCLLLLRVGRDWLLFEGDVAADVLGQSSRATLIDSSLYYWTCKPKPDELLGAVKICSKKT